jgi:hypothetical protein
MRIGACFVAKVNGYLDVDDTSPVFYPYFFCAPSVFINHQPSFCFVRKLFSYISVLVTPRRSVLSLGSSKYLIYHYRCCFSDTFQEVKSKRDKKKEVS